MGVHHDRERWWYEAESRKNAGNGQGGNNTNERGDDLADAAAIEFFPKRGGVRVRVYAQNACFGCPDLPMEFFPKNRYI